MSSLNAGNLNNNYDDDTSSHLMSRRESIVKTLLSGATVAAVFTNGLLSYPEDSAAFANKISSKVCIR
jgi:hypothetical protein